MIRIIIPAYNEEKNIKNCVTAIDDNLNNTRYKIYVVNDGSKDKTALVLKNLVKRYPIEVTSHATNLGVSVAFESGLSRAVSQGRDGDVVIIMEGDGTSDPRLLKVMSDKIRNGCNLVIASRYSPKGEYKRFPYTRLIISKLANLSLRTLLAYPKVKDYTIFYRAYNYDALNKVLKKYKDRLFVSKLFAANVELLIKVIPFVKSAEEIPFVYDYGLKKGKSGLNLKKNFWQYLRLLAFEKTNTFRNK